MPPRGRTRSSMILMPRSDGSMFRVARLYGAGPEKDDLATFSFQTPNQSQPTRATRSAPIMTASIPIYQRAAPLPRSG